METGVWAELVEVEGRDELEVVEEVVVEVLAPEALFLADCLLLVDEGALEDFLFFWFAV